jgi:hypothetical protein
MNELRAHSTLPPARVETFDSPTYPRFDKITISCAFCRARTDIQRGAPEVFAGMLVAALRCPCRGGR